MLPIFFFSSCEKNFLADISNKKNSNIENRCKNIKHKIFTFDKIEDWKCFLKSNEKITEKYWDFWVKIDFENWKFVNPVYYKCGFDYYSDWKKCRKTTDKKIPFINKVFDYNESFINHISISLVGWEYISIKEKNTSNVISLSDQVDKIDSSESYQLNNSIFSNKIILPSNLLYKITLKKIPDFDFFKVFIKIPNLNKKQIEIINYEDIKIKDNEIVVITVWVKNNDKNIKDKNLDNYGPDYDVLMLLKNKLNKK